MLISFDWLKQLIQTDKSAEEIGALLTGAGLEVEGIHSVEMVKGGLEGLVLGQVLTCEKHPDADKLNITTVDIGETEPKQIVCGAPNVAAGQKVVVATVNATLYPENGEPFKIKKSKIRGAVSEGMICAEDEIGLGKSHEGIMVLDTPLPNGTAAADFFNLRSDEVFEIGLTPNRADAASHFGVARDLQALLKTRVSLPNIGAFKVQNTSRPIEVVVQNTEACPRYAGVSITGVQVQESPEWLKKRLIAIDLEPINNVVDVTNYVLHELGQPMHAFDADKIAGDKIIVNTVAENTPFITLDGVARKLRSNDLVISNAEEPMVIAGIFGGKKAGVTHETTTVFLESAYFNPAWIRSTAQAHNLKTDSSFRYERGTDPNMVIFALKRAAMLIQEVAGGTVSSEIVDVYPQKIENTSILLHVGRVHKLIGQFIGKEHIKSILTDLEILIAEENEDELVLSVPPHKVDVKREADVIEEILRIFGFNNIVLKEHLNAGFLAQFPNPDPEILRKQVGISLAGNGFHEILTNSLTDARYYAEAGTDSGLVHILNYNSEELNAMRKTMVYSGLEVLRHNINRRQRDLKLFEIGTVYFKTETKYKEQQVLALFLSGNIQAESWQQKPEKTTFQHVAGYVQNVLQQFGLLNQLQTAALNHEYLKEGIAFVRKDVVVAQVGLLSPKVCKQADVKETVWYAELNWDFILKNYRNKLTFDELPKFPEVRRDLSLVLDKNITFDEVKAIAFRTERKLLQQINVFDVYEGDKIDSGKKAYAISFNLLDKNQTLTDKVIDNTMNRLMQQFEKQLGAVIRK